MMSERRAELLSLLGDLPAMDREISSRLVNMQDCGTYILETHIFDLNGIETVPGYIALPKGDGPFPTIIYNHAHGGDYKLGKDELIKGRGAIFSPYAEALCAQGYAAICIDFWCFGERRGMAEDECFKDMLWHGQVLWGMMVYDHLRIIDFVDEGERFDSTRIGTLGLSMGSTMAWWLAALDERIKVCVDICCLTEFESLRETRNLNGHGLYYYVPSLLKHFSTVEINELIIPRAHLSLAGNEDKLTPPQGLDRIDEGLKKSYAEASAADKWTLLRYEVGHLETAEMRHEIMNYLSIHLK
ncbi:MAG: alpha/beta hydrolase [Planctomycetes bacterium]|nr:alpha/beta hydrolase [Planctomycetota bacterium]